MSKEFEIKIKGKSKSTPPKGVYDVNIIPYSGGTFARYELNGKIHREDGPAIVAVKGHVEWYLDGKELTFDDWLKETISMGWAHDRNEMLLMYYTRGLETMVAQLPDELEAGFTHNKHDGLMIPMLEQFVKQGDFINREAFLGFNEYMASQYYHSTA